MASLDDEARDAAAAAAVAHECVSGQRLALGSGRAVLAVLRNLAARAEQGERFSVVVASRATAHAARRAGIDVVYPDRPCDVMLDGADTVLPDGRLLKGGGGALVREKLLVRLSRRFVAVVEHAKVSTADDEAGRSVSVAVLPFTWEQTLSELAQHCSSVELRTSRGAPYTTDDGLLIADCVVGPDSRLDAATAAFSSTLGVVGHGVFTPADVVFSGHQDGSVERLEFGAQRRDGEPPQR